MSTFTVFITLEDEWGFSNTVIPLKIKNVYRKEIMTGAVLFVGGYLKEQDTVISIQAKTVLDISDWINELDNPQMTLPLLVPRSDEIKHGRVGSKRGKEQLLKSRDFR